MEKTPTAGPTVDGLVSPDGQAGCLRQGALDAALELVGKIYDNSPPDTATRQCRTALSGATRTYARGVAAAVRACELKKLLAKKPLPPDTDCWAFTAEKRAKLAAPLTGNACEGN